MSSPVDGSGPDGPTSLQDLFAIVCSPITQVVGVFTLVLYAHYRHLHSASNHLLMLSVGSLGLLSGLIFLGVFGFGQSSEARFSNDNCETTGVLHAWLLQTTHMCVAAHWWILALLVRWRYALPTNVGPLVMGIVIVASSAVVACLPLAQSSQISQNGQSWCEAHAAWLVWVFQAGAIFAGIVGMVLATVPPLLHSAVNSEQKGLIARRLALSSMWAIVGIVDATASSVSPSKRTGLKTIQAALLPLSGALICLMFLLPERMLTVRALGLPPGVDPPYGFTSAMKVLPDKLCRGQSYHQPEDDNNRRDPFTFHNIDLEVTPLVSPTMGKRSRAL